MWGRGNSPYTLWHDQGTQFPLRLIVNQQTKGETTKYLQQEKTVTVDAVFESLHVRRRRLPAHRDEYVVGRVVHSVHSNSFRSHDRAILQYNRTSRNLHVRAKRGVEKKFNDTINRISALCVRVIIKPVGLHWECDDTRNTELGTNNSGTFRLQNSNCTDL